MDITMNKIKKFNDCSVLEDKIQIDAEEEILIPYEEADNKIIILVSNDGAGSGDITFEKGDMLQATEDLTITVPAGKTIAVALESGKFKKKNGNVKAIASAELGIQLIALP